MAGRERFRTADRGEEGVSLRTLLGLLRRRKLYFLISVALGLAAAVVAGLVLPERYRAEVLLASEPMVDPQGQAAPAAITVERQLTRISEVLFRRSLLEQVSEEFGLVDGEATTEDLAELRDSIELRVEGEESFTLGYGDGDPRRAAAVTARLAGLLVERTRAAGAERAEARSAFLDGQLPALAERLAEQEREIEAYKLRHAAEIPEGAETSFKLLDSAQTRLGALAATITDDEARRTGIRREMAELERQGVSMKAPESAAQKRAHELELALRQLRRRYTEEHPEVLRATAELAELERAIAEGATGPAGAPDYSPVQLRYLELTAELGAVEQRLARSRAERAAVAGESTGYRQRLAAAPRHEAALAAMKRDLDATRLRYDELADQVAEARRAESLEKTREGATFRILEAPRVPTEPFAPRRLRLLLMGLLAGLGLGLALAMVAEQMDTTFRDVEGFEETTGLPVLATIPPLSSGGGPGNTGEPRAAAFDHPTDRFAAEQYRILAAKLIRRGGRPTPTAVLITSPAGGEGKSTTAVHLAEALTQMVDEEVLLIDADLHRPQVHALLGLPPADGLATLLAAPEDDPELHLRRHRGLAILETGQLTAELRTALASPLAQRLFQRLRQRFAYVVVDAPPVLAVAEGLILQQMVDSILLVVRARTTPRAAVERALESLDLSRLAGVVLNDLDAGAAYPSYYHRYFERPAAPATVQGGRGR